MAASRSVLTVLCPTPVLFLVLFLFFSGVSKLILPQGEGSEAVAAVGGNTPVVLAVLDEFAGYSLRDAQGRIDASSIPQFRGAGTGCDLVPECHDRRGWDHPCRARDPERPGPGEGRTCRSSRTTPRTSSRSWGELCAECQRAGHGPMSGAALRGGTARIDQGPSEGPRRRSESGLPAPARSGRPRRRSGSGRPDLRWFPPRRRPRTDAAVRPAIRARCRHPIRGLSGPDRPVAAGDGQGGLLAATSHLHLPPRATPPYAVGVAALGAAVRDRGPRPPGSGRRQLGKGSAPRAAGAASVSSCRPDTSTVWWASS